MVLRHVCSSSGVPQSESEADDTSLKCQSSLGSRRKMKIGDRCAAHFSGAKLFRSQSALMKKFELRD